MTIPAAIRRGGCLVLLLLLTSCGWRESKTADEWLHFTWSGLAGIDTLTFQGQAAVARGERQQLEEQISFTGELQEHRKLKLQMTLPAGQLKKDQTRDGRGLTTANAQSASGELLMAWNGKSWESVDDNISGLVSGLARFNPLGQLEAIHQAGKFKTVRADQTAARGTRVLRIQLDPEKAEELLAMQLTGEMDRIRAGWNSNLQSLPASQRQQVEQMLEREWSAGTERLQKMLDTCQAESVFYLTINRNTGLPERLTSQTSLAYTTPLGTSEQEVLFTDSRFDYRD